MRLKYQIIILLFMMTIGVNAQQKLLITIDGAQVEATLVDNVSTRALVAALAEDDITYTANDYGGFEKVGALGRSLPTCDSQTTTKAGDIVLYNGNQIVIFYGSNSWNYSRLGSINGLNAQQIKEFLGNGQRKITLSLPASVSGIESVRSEEKSAQMFDLQGRAIDEPRCGEIYIQNGVKRVKH